MRNFGISSATPGTLITARAVAKRKPLPRKRSRDKAYPARLSRKTLASVMTMVTRTEFDSHRMIGMEVSPPMPKIRFHVDESSGLGIRLSGSSVALALDLKDVAIWMKN